MDRRKILCKILTYVDLNLDKKITLQMLADKANYSLTQLTRLFSEFIGISPIKYVSIIRVIKASQELSDSNKSVTEIVFDCGFESLEVFERNFKMYFKVSPTEFRKKGFSEPDPFYMSAKIYYERLRNNMLIDNGAGFDWGKTAAQYTMYRNIYPDDFWKNLNKLGIGSGKKILDIGTGTGILPMNMVKYGGTYVGADISEEMITQAALNCADIENVSFVCADAHCLPFENSSFDIVTALQCWVYFDKQVLIPELLRILKPEGELYVAFMTWLPDEDEIIRKSFSLIRKYNPNWSGFMKRFDIQSFTSLKGSFDVQDVFKKDYCLPFTKESWCGRMIASRGIGAELPEEKIMDFKNDLIEMLRSEKNDFTVLHEAVIIKLKRNDK